MDGDADNLSAGQCWRFNTAHGFEDARLIIGAIVSPSAGERIVCFTVTRAPTTIENGVKSEAMISFIPMAEVCVSRHHYRA